MVTKVAAINASVLTSAFQHRDALICHYKQSSQAFPFLLFSEVVAEPFNTVST